MIKFTPHPDAFLWIFVNLFEKEIFVLERFFKLAVSELIKQPTDFIPEKTGHLYKFKKIVCR
jgi:hypothetical protein